MSTLIPTLTLTNIIDTYTHIRVNKHLRRSLIPIEVTLIASTWDQSAALRSTWR